jgi:hypothetical protein
MIEGYFRFETFGMETLNFPASEWNRMTNSTLLRPLLIRLLEHTNGEPVEVKKIHGSLRITSEAFEALLQHLVDDGLVTMQGESISLSLEQRIGVAMSAVKIGADPEVISGKLGWLEFEELSAKFFEANDFRVLRRFRFTAEGRRWEIDLLAVRAPYLVCGECKRWGAGMGNQTARRIIETHLEKAEVFAKHIEDLRRRIGLLSWSKAIIVPMTLTLSKTPMEIYRRMPSVSVISLPSFINEFDGQLERLANFKVSLKAIKPEKKQTVLTRRVIGSRRARRRL